MQEKLYYKDNFFKELKEHYEADNEYKQFLTYYKKMALFRIR